MSASPPTTPSAGLDDPIFRAAVIDLLGAIAYGEISAVERLAEDAALAPRLDAKVAVLAMAAHEFAHLEALQVRLRELGADPCAAMQPFVDPVEAFHVHARPSDWAESLVKAYVGDALAADFYREVAAFLDPVSREVVITALADAGHADFAVTELQLAMSADPKLAGRLALWGRRLMGEALIQGQRVAAERDALGALLGGSGGSLDLTEIGRMFNRLTERHAARMAKLGLDS